MKSQYDKINYTKAFLKWLGGKTQLLKQIMPMFPKKMNNYHELFLGGGSVLLALLTLQKENLIEISGNIYAYDINELLINLYKNIQQNKDKLYVELMKLKSEYTKISILKLPRAEGKKRQIPKPNSLEEANQSKEAYYYWTRKQFNLLIQKKKQLQKLQQDIEKDENIKMSAMFWFLNKTCFRGVYRMGKNGFNVPFGNYKTTPEITTVEKINYLSELVKNVIFTQKPFIESIKLIKKDDFVYLDPPYVPEKKSSFVNYTDNVFDTDIHTKLFNELLVLNKKKIKFIMSNSNTDYVNETFKDFNIKKIDAKRSINSKNPASKTKEVIVSNFQ